MADISQIILPGGETPQNIKALKIPYGTCSTAAATAAKTVTIKSDNGSDGNDAPFVLEVGAIIAIKFTVTNTAANPTLSVNGSTAKAIYYRGAAIAKGTLAAKRTYCFTYNGTQWELIGDVDTNTNTDTKVTQTKSTTESLKPLMLGQQSAATITELNTTITASITNLICDAENLYAQPSTGMLGAKSFNIDGSAKMQYNTTTESIDFIFT